MTDIKEIKWLNTTDETVTVPYGKSQSQYHIVNPGCSIIASNKYDYRGTGLLPVSDRQHDADDVPMKYTWEEVQALEQVEVHEIPFEELMFSIKKIDTEYAKLVEECEELSKERYNLQNSLNRMESDLGKVREAVGTIRWKEILGD